MSDRMSDTSLLHVHAYLPDSRANGPGRRAVVWVQGCTLGCPGCFNPGTHPATGGELLDPADLAERILERANDIEGVTISGGEPLQQAGPLLVLLAALRRGGGLSVLLFTGYTWGEVTRRPDAGALLECIDVLIAGRYDQARRVATGLLGSANQTVHLLTGRYTMDDLAAVPEAEVIVGLDGSVVISGVAPLSSWQETKR